MGHDQVLATDDMVDLLVKTLTSLDLLETTYMFCECTTYTPQPIKHPGYVGTWL